MILFSLFYKRSFHLKEKTPIAILPSFKTGHETHFSLSIKNFSKNYYFVGLANSSLPDNIWNITKDYGTICNSKEGNELSFTVANTMIFNETQEWSVNTENDLIVMPIVISCNESEIDTYVDAAFETNGHYLDKRNAHFIHTSPFRVIIPIILIAMIFISISCGKSFYVRIHAIFSILCVVSLAHEGMMCVNFFEQEKNGEVAFAHQLIMIVLDLAQQALTCIASYLLASGWSISTNEFSWKKIIGIIILSLGLTRIDDLRYWYEIKEFIFIPVVLQLAFLTMIANIIVTSTQKYEFDILAYEFVMETLGTKPETTPIRSYKIRSYIVLFITIAFYLMRIVYVLVTYFFFIDIWIADLVYWLINMIYIFVIIILGLPKKFSKEVREQVFRDENMLDRLVRKDLDQERMPHKNPKDWTEGEPLPVPPVVQKITFHLIIEENQENEEPLLTDGIIV